MASHRYVFLLFALVRLCFSTRIVYALDQNEADAAIKRFLASKQTGQEDAESQGSTIADLNGDGKPEIVLVWRVLGPTYSRDNLTVLSDGPKGYSPAASMSLNGQAKLSSVKDGTIFVEQLVLGKNDPLCCPSVKKQARYKWLGKKISEVK